MGFVVEYAIGGAAATSLGTVAAYMFGTHALIGIGEGVITALTVMAVASARPDLVYLLRTPRAGVGMSATRAALGVLVRLRRGHAGDRRRGVLLRQRQPRRARLGDAAGLRGRARPTERRGTRAATASPSTPPSTRWRRRHWPTTRSEGTTAPAAWPGSSARSSRVAVAGAAFWVIARPPSRSADRWAQARTRSTATATRSVHRTPAEVKIVCLVVFVLAVVATPREMFWPYAASMPLIMVVRAGGRPHPAALDPAPDADRGAVRGARGAAAVRRGG